jgi:ElaB/YqjD/DUF883 family membrane-anchored ribosome-binding protein
MEGCSDCAKKKRSEDRLIMTIGMGMMVSLIVEAVGVGRNPWCLVAIGAGCLLGFLVHLRSERIRKSTER